jgi:hypothetical protein
MKLLCFMFTLLAFTLHSAYSYGQQDTTIPTTPNITEVPLKFIKQTNEKIDKYANRITSKTEKTLERLSKWENKVHKLLLKVDANVAEQLFGEGRETFATMLAKVKEGKSLAENYSKKYEAYNDKLITHIKFLESQQQLLDNKYIQPLKTAKAKIATLEKEVAETNAAEKRIQERTKELLKAAYKVLGKNRLLSKIGAENYTYVETLKNYKTIFSEPGKAEKLALDILNKIPAAKEFLQQNSMLASLFGSPSSGAGAASLAGLQTRADVNALIQGRIAAGGPNAAAQISANMQAAQAELTKLKDNMIKGGNSHDADIPDFKKSDVRSKTFKQRIEIGSDFQFGKPNKIVSSQANLGLSIGYKLNDKSIVGVGLSYKLDYGSIDNFYVKHGGVGVRSFVDYKIKKQFFVTGSYEINYNEAFKNFSEIQNANGTTGIGNPLQSSGLLGITKKINMKTKFVKGTKLQLLYDFLYKTHTTEANPVVFRVGYNF